MLALTLRDFDVTLPSSGLLLTGHHAQYKLPPIRRNTNDRSQHSAGRMDETHCR